MTVCLKPALWDCITSTAVISNWQIKDRRSQGRMDKDHAPVIKMQSRNWTVLNETVLLTRLAVLLQELGASLFYRGLFFFFCGRVN